jgi:hypothetical protein
LQLKKSGIHFSSGFMVLCESRARQYFSISEYEIQLFGGAGDGAERVSGEQAHIGKDILVSQQQQPGDLL